MARPCQKQLPSLSDEHRGDFVLTPSGNLFNSGTINKGGTTCELGAYCHGKEGRNDKLQIMVGLICNRETSFSFHRKADFIREDMALDGFYVIWTSVGPEVLTSAEAVKAYKELSHVETAFRLFKTVDLEIRPIYHALTDRVRAHTFLCMLAYYVE